jgi:uncharacterized protein (TIGR02466 family)
LIIVIMLQLTQINPLFYSPLIVFNNEELLYINSIVWHEIEQRMTAEIGVDRSNWGGWHSDDDFFDRSEQGHVTLQTLILDAIQQATTSIAPKFDLDRYMMNVEGWVNVANRSCLNTPHDHPAWVWSGCYYVKVPKQDKEYGGKVEFMDHRTNIRTLTVDGAPCFASKFSVMPKAGMLIIFPSYLRHWVYPNESDESRVSIAFNARFISK